jgi:hypothetical protein
MLSICRMGAAIGDLCRPEMRLRDKEWLIRAFAAAIADMSEDIPGPDMGPTSWRCDGSRPTGRAVGRPREIGGIPLDEIGATGFDLAVAIDVAREYIGLPLAGRGSGPLSKGRVSGSGSRSYRFYLDKGGMNSPVANAFELGKSLLCRSDRLFSARRRFDDDRSLAAAKELTGSRNFIHETHAIGWHLLASHAVPKACSPDDRQATMIWINFASIQGMLC